jgi:hypothetical protein
MRANSRFSKPSVYSPEDMSIRLQVHTIAIDDDPFGAQPEPLFEAGFSSEPDQSPGAEDSMPGNAFARSKSPHNLTRRARMAACRSYIAVRRNLAFGDAPDGFQDIFKHG